jgi:phenylpyruvate tautomerase PptA (4-oxalocrotonate tautomerase family)
MRTEVHVHGAVPLRHGVSHAQIETALKPWLDYIDEDSLADARSAYEDEPGIAFDNQRRMLELCWTGDVGRNFREHIEAALQSLNPYTEQAAEIEVTYYHEDGQDEYGVVFVGPTTEAIHEAQRQAMIEDVTQLLGRHFGEAEIGEVITIVNQLFNRGPVGAKGDSPSAQPALSPANRRRLH